MAKSRSWPLNRAHADQRGFTLIEVLVALAVLAIALGAVIKGVGATVNNLAYVKEKTLAHWVAMNRLAEIQSLEQWPSGTDTGSEQMAGHEWFWKTTVNELGKEYKDVHQVQVEVTRERNDKQPLARLMGLVARPAGAVTPN